MAKLFYKDLIVWQKSVELVGLIYKMTSHLPKYEQYSLMSQMRRASISIPSNIAEGNSRPSIKDYKRFLYISFGSCAELETQICICEQQYPEIDTSNPRSLLDEIQKMLNAMMHKLIQ